MSDNFRIRTVDALSDDSLQNNFRGAMDFLQDKRHQAFQDLEFEKLRSEGADIRKNVIAHLPDLLEKLERKCIDNGIHVHWAEDAQQACRIVERIAKDNEVKQVVKGKSMVSEEIELNQHLEAQGIECIETDMGEYIVQLDHEKSSHIIMPAIHKTKEQIAQLFADKLNEDFGKPPKDATVDELIGVGRKVLRQKFMQADMGISGVNFAIAETGTLCLVANEGNGRISTGVPDIHVALIGLEKVIPSFAELPTLLKLLTRSATGQIMTTYLNMISSPRKDQELDGPSQVHLVIIDNKRSAMYQDDVLQETLTCIRCGACMNHYPVYTRIGGHAYGSTYPGPIEQIVTPQIEGIEHAGDLLDACSLNGACGEACPVSIDLPVVIRELRNKQTSLKPPHRVIWNIWRQFYRSTKRHALLSKFVSLCSRLPMPTPKAWSNTRTFPKPAPESFSTLIKKQKENERESE
ncbi:MAG: lactate utilization protein [Oleiphilaceae bacterium]|nr:lactate utilization protein [Oleiphilaceae bacterium]